jgi:hypothetical protein
MDQTWVDPGYGWLPGVVNNHFSVPSASWSNLLTEGEFVVRVLPSSLSTNYFLSKYQSISTGGWEFGTVTGSFLRFFTSDGIAGAVNSYQAPTSLTGLWTGPVIAWFKAVWEVVGGTQHRVTFYYSLEQTNIEPVSWISLGDNTKGAVVPSAARSVAVRVGHRVASTVSPTARYFRAIVRSSKDGPVVLDIDFTNKPGGTASFLAVTGQTVTVAATIGGATIVPAGGGASVQATATSGSFLPGPTTWEGSSSASIEISAQSGRFEALSAHNGEPKVLARLDERRSVAILDRQRDVVGLDARRTIRRSE